MPHATRDSLLLTRPGLRRGALLLGTAASWLLLAGLARAADTDVRLSSIGFLPDLEKIATITGGGSTFELCRASDGSVVASGDLAASETDAQTGEVVRRADFSAVTTPGEYYLEVPGVGRSVDFPIDAGVYRSQLTTAMLGFYGWRSGTEVEFTHQGQTFRQGPGHLQDGLLDYLGQPGVTRDGSRGWYDAGDYGKYTVNTAITLGMMLQAYEQFGPGLEALALPIPEAGGALPDYLDELKWQYDWLFTMQYSATDGRVSHKLTSIDFAGFVLPEDDTAPTYYSPYGSAATAGFVAVMAKGARVFRPYDAALADRMLTAARLSYQWLLDNPGNHDADISAFNTGGYGTSDADDRLWAAAELWETTGEAAILQDFEDRAQAEGLTLDREFDWGNVKNLGLYTYALSTRSGKTASVASSVRSAVIARANELRSNREANGYGRAIDGYWWGINGVVARMCMTLQVANALAPDPRYLDACADQIGHLYGRNVHDRSYVTGEGRNPPLYPHHRPSAADGVARPFPGLLVGGAWPEPADWYDTEDDYEHNEVAINWNGALVYALAGFLSEAAGGEGGTSGTGGAAGAGAASGGGAGGAPGSGGVAEPGGAGPTGSGGLAGGSAPSDDGGGCGCRVAQPGPWRSSLLLGACAALALTRLRRRRSRQ